MPTVRSIFLSDIHLGTRACQADRLLEFMRGYVAENVFLLGDVVDFWAMRRSINWTTGQNTFVQKLLKRARHGDEFDQITRHHRWIAVLGDVMYDVLVRLNTLVSFFRRRFGMRCYWSLAGYAKRRVKKALQFIFDFEDAAMRAARLSGLDGIICGHIHCAVIREADGVVYANCGDWVDSCTAIVEHLDGRLELIEWGAVFAETVIRQEEEEVCVS